MGKNLLLQDACVLINPLATDPLEEIAHHLAYQFAIASSVAAETIYLRRPADSSREQADLRAHVTSGLVKVLDVETELEQSRYLYESMVAHVQMGEEGGERFGRRHFLEPVSVFTSSPDFEVLHGNHPIGTLDWLALSSQLSTVTAAPIARGTTFERAPRFRAIS
jgi:hypothetical protein